MILDRFLSKEKSSGGNVNEPQLQLVDSRWKKGSYFPMNGNIPPTIIIDWLLYNILCMYYCK
jgi:hypothetical protein